MQAPAFIAPELANPPGAATQSDSVLYVNMKGVAVSPGKRAAEVVGVVFFVVIVAPIILLIVSESKSGGPARHRSGGLGRRRDALGALQRLARPRPLERPVGRHHRLASPPPRGYGYVPPGRGPVYSGPQVGIGIVSSCPSRGPAHTHEGAVAENDEYFAGDQAYLSATLVSTYDGRVLWHARQSIDVDLDKPADVQKMIDRLVESIPPSLSQGPAPAPAAH
jgi:hypothetical protein